MFFWDLKYIRLYRLNEDEFIVCDKDSKACKYKEWEFGVNIDV